MTDLYAIVVNGGLFYDKTTEDNNMFTLEQVNDIISEWSEGHELVDEYGTTFDVDDIIAFGSVDIVNAEMIEWDEKFITLNIVQLSHNN